MKIHHYHYFYMLRESEVYSKKAPQIVIFCIIGKQLIIISIIICMSSSVDLYALCVKHNKF